MSLEAVPEMRLKPRPGPPSCQAAPSQCAQPRLLIAQTSLALAPQTPSKGSVDPELTTDHAVPFQWMMLPRSPTAQTSLEALPQTARRTDGAMKADSVHWFPSQWVREG